MQPVFSDGVVGIRRFRPHDGPLHFAAARESIDELSTWMVWCRTDYSLQDSEAFISAQDAEWEQGGQYSFVVFDVKDGAFLGSVGLSQINRAHKFANLGYWVRRSRTRQGVASTAVRLIAQFGLRQLGFNRLEIVIAAGNKPSQRVAEKAGAKREGVLRDRLILHAKAHDAIMYSLVPGDLKI
jgi:ribosomal-protein-serine acetyltransferase